MLYQLYFAMTFQWTPHRFSGGALALDVANSVVLRFDADRRIDRFAMTGQLADFPAAASRLSRERAAFGAIAPVSPEDTETFLALREAIDAHFRHRTDHGRDDNRLLAALLLMMSETFARHAEPAAPCPLDLATAKSALGLVSASGDRRMKICPNCHWLFIDHSKNRSRTWCDMAVCGNRAKARLHYRRKSKGEMS